MAEAPALSEGQAPGVTELGAAFTGVRVVEVAQWAFVPAAASIFADLGADVIKIEHAVRGDPYRGLVTSSLPTGAADVNHLVEQTNRGKRSVGLDLAHPRGLEVLLRLVAGADVFFTNLLPRARAKLGIDTGQLLALNPRLVYARGHGQGQRGPDADLPGYDGTAFWARGGFAHAHSPDGRAPGQQRPAEGDRSAALSLALGVAAALFRRERTGAGGVVDASLLGTATWMLASDLVATARAQAAGAAAAGPLVNTNPLAASYETADGRWISLIMLESDRWWPMLCRYTGREELVTDPRFDSAAHRAENHDECRRELAKTFAAVPLATWRERLAPMRGPWAVAQDYAEVIRDPQVTANDYLQAVDDDRGRHFSLVTAPLQLDEVPPRLSRAPDHAEHTDAVLLELGYDMDEVLELKIAGAVT
jgi:crotonobetainyl-CoA:carnitine CoA-transferase CaiB-like acyl-CoA transferase